MKPTLFVSSVMSNIKLPKRKLESFANCNKKVDTFPDNLALQGYENISWQFLNTSEKRNVQIVLSNKEDKRVICLEIPATADFLAICTKGHSGSFELEFGISLS